MERTGDSHGEADEFKQSAVSYRQTDLLIVLSRHSGGGGGELEERNSKLISVF